MKELTDIANDLVPLLTFTGDIYNSKELELSYFDSQLWFGEAESTKLMLKSQ